jgi:hypothetical protein
MGRVIDVMKRLRDRRTAGRGEHPQIMLEADRILGPGPGEALRPSWCARRR